MFKSTPKEPFKFGLYISLFHKRFMIVALTCVFVATILDRFTVIILRNITNAVIAPHVDFATVWFWAICYPILLLCSQIVWRLSGFSGMRWFTNYRATA